MYDFNHTLRKNSSFYFKICSKFNIIEKTNFYLCKLARLGDHGENFVDVHLGFDELVVQIYALVLDVVVRRCPAQVGRVAVPF